MDKNDGMSGCLVSLSMFSRRNVIGKNSLDQCGTHISARVGILPVLHFNVGTGVDCASRGGTGASLFDTRKFHPSLPVCGSGNRFSVSANRTGPMTGACGGGRSGVCHVVKAMCKRISV